MKPLLFSILIISQLFSQNISQMDQAQMQGMMQEMQKMQVCMSKVDMHSLQNLQSEAVIMEKEIKKLCQNKQRKQAQDKAIAYAHKVMNMPAVKQIKECSKNTAMGKMMDININDFKSSHVCDEEDLELGLPNNQRINW